MLRRSLSTAAVCVIGAWGAVALSAGGQALTRREADSLEKKLDAVLERGAKPVQTPRSLRTVFTDREVNAYFKFQGAEQLPVGVLNPNIAILDLGRVTGSAVVNLDSVRLSKDRTWTDPLAYVSGVLELRVAGTLRAANGRGAFDLESATLNGVPIPRAFLQEVVSYYSRTADSPEGFLLDRPFDLPQRIRQVEFQRGAAVVVQ